MRRTPFSCLAGLLAACATPPPPPPAAEDLIREAFTHPKLDTCDELVCYHLLGRQFRVRAASCTPIPHQPWHLAPEVACTYERQRMPKEWGMPIRAVDGEQQAASKPLGPWEKARTSFMVHSERSWSVLEDPYYEPGR